LCYSPTAHLNSYKFFRNYQSPQQITQDVTVLEAVRATWASPGILPPISIGPKGREETVMSAGNGYANPIREVIKEAYHVFGPKARVSFLLSLGSGFGGVVALNDRKNVAQGARMDCERVAQEMKQRPGMSNVYYRLSVDRGLEGWGPFIIDFGAMKSHVDDYLGRDGDMDQCIAASTKAGSISMDRICKHAYFKRPLLISCRCSQGTRNSVEAWHTASIGILCDAQEANECNHQCSRIWRRIYPAGHGNFGVRGKWEDAIGVEVRARFPRTVRSELADDSISDCPLATSMFSSSTPAPQTV
jgi:hypothetical protein